MNNRMEIYTDSNKIEVLEESRGDFTINEMVRLGYKVYIELGVSDDGTRHVVKDMSTSAAVVFLTRPAP